MVGYRQSFISVKSWRGQLYIETKITFFTKIYIHFCLLKNKEVKSFYFAENSVVFTDKALPNLHWSTHFPKFRQ